MRLNPTRLVESILRHENARELRRFKEPGGGSYASGAYRVPGEDHYTIGWGTTRWPGGLRVEEGQVASLGELYQIALGDIMQATLDAIVWLPRLDMTTRRNEVIVEMVYQMGLPRMNKFVRTRALIAEARFKAASKEMRNSKWAREDSPERAQVLSNWFATG